MKKAQIIFMVFASCGCVDLGRIGMHPELKTAYFDGNQHKVATCLYSAAISQHLFFMEDDPFPDGSQRYNLQDANYVDVAWVNFSTFNSKQTSVDFFYAPHAPDVTSAINAMISECKNSLY